MANIPKKTRCAGSAAAFLEKINLNPMNFAYSRSTLGPIIAR